MDLCILHGALVYNGILGATPNNNRSLQVEKTMMNRFIQQVESHKSFPELDTFFPGTTVGSINDTLVSSEMYIMHLKLLNTTNLGELLFNNDLVVPVGQMSQHALQTHEMESLMNMYQTILPDYNIFHVSRLCCRFGRAKLGNKLLSSRIAKSDRSSYVSANWLNNTMHAIYRPGYVRFFIKHNITLEKQNKDTLSVETLLAYIGWYKPHPEMNYLPSPVTLWYPECEPISASSFMPINRIACRCAQSESYMEFAGRPHNNGSAVTIIPIENINLMI